jgi:hypothetical protein
VRRFTELALSSLKIESHFGHFAKENGFNVVGAVISFRIEQG